MSEPGGGTIHYTALNYPTDTCTRLRADKRSTGRTGVDNSYHPLYGTKLVAYGAEPIRRGVHPIHHHRHRLPLPPSTLV